MTSTNSGANRDSGAGVASAGAEDKVPHKEKYSTKVVVRSKKGRSAQGQGQGQQATQGPY